MAKDIKTSAEFSAGMSKVHVISKESSRAIKNTDGRRFLDEINAAIKFITAQVYTSRAAVTDLQQETLQLHS